MALPGALVWTSRFLFATLRSIQINLYIRTQRTSLDDIWCWFWKRLVLLHCIKTALNSAEVHSQRHEGGLFQLSLFRHFLSFILPKYQIRYENMTLNRSGSFKPTHTLFSLHVNCGFFSAAWQSLFQYSLFCRAASQTAVTAVTASQNFSQASFLAFVKRREASGLGDSSCWKKGKLDVFFYIILWKTVKYELRVPGNWISSIMCTTVHKNPSHHMDNVTKMLLLPLYAGNSGWRKTNQVTRGEDDRVTWKKVFFAKKRMSPKHVFFGKKWLTQKEGWQGRQITSSQGWRWLDRNVSQPR